VEGYLVMAHSPTEKRKKRKMPQTGIAPNVTRVNGCGELLLSSWLQWR
jgi:hypothetical protein